MLFLKHTPTAPLSRFVEYLWLLSDTPAHAKERILPTGTLELVINLSEDEIRIYDEAGASRHLSGTVISGAYAGPFVIDTAEHAFIMGVHFRPAGAWPFTRAAPGELSDGHVDVAMVWGSGAAELRERLCSAVTHRQRFELLERSLLAHALDGRGGRGEVEFAVQCLAEPGASVRAVVASVGLSHRHFASVFREQVGMTPKLFQRVRRFQRAVALTQGRPPADRAGLACRCGYYDQTHLIRDFREFAHCTPNEYVRQHSENAKDHHLMLG
jgi:AraC-like DNA-binding protein